MRGKHQQGAEAGRWRCGRRGRHLSRAVPRKWVQAWHPPSQGVTVADATLGVRPAEVGDADAIADVHVRSWPRAYRGHLPDSVLEEFDRSERANRWKRLIPRTQHVLRVAVRAENVVGFLFMISSRDSDASAFVGEIAALYVDLSSWQSGVGRALIKSAVSVASGVGYGSLTLWVLESNTRTRALYEAMRFVADGESQIDIREGYALAAIRYCRTTGEWARLS